MISVFLFSFLYFLNKVRLKKIAFIYLFFPLFTIAGYISANISLQESDFVKELSRDRIYCEIKGEVYNSSKTMYGYKLFVKNTTVTVEESEYDGGRCVVYCEENFNKGDIISVLGKSEGFEQNSNPGEFNSQQYYYSLKIHYKMYAEIITLLEKNKNPIYSMSDKAGNKLRDTLYKLTDDKSASVFSAMLLGDKDELDSEISDLFSTCGIGHILAISGLHISLIGMGFYKLLRKMGLGYVGGMLIAGSMIIFYGSITGNGISTIRAIIMFLLAVYANVAGRTYDLISATALAATIMLIDSPLLIYNSGFLLSFMAIVGIGVVNPALCKIIPSENKIIRSIVSGFSIQLVTLPVIMYSYYEIPVYSILINLIVIPLMTYVMVSALSAGIIGIWFPLIGKFCIGPGVYILRLYEQLCKLCLKLPGAVWICGKPDSWQIVAFYIVLGISVWFMHHRKQIRYAFGMAVSIVIIVLRFNYSFELTFIDVGQGDGIFIRSGNYNILVDCGSSDNKSLYEYTLEPFLMSEGVAVIDYVFVTHPDSDHISGIKDLLRSDKIQVKTLILPSVQTEDEAYVELCNIAEEAGAEVGTIHRGIRMKIGVTDFTCLHPENESTITDRNDYSTVLLAEYEDFEVLLTGDISSGQEELIAGLIEKNVDIDILKASHHGSGFSSSLIFLQKFNPETIVISCGKDNEYGHPAKEALERMEQIGAYIQCTYEEGAIIYKRGGIRVFL